MVSSSLAISAAVISLTALLILVDDHVVIDLVKKQVEQFEKENHSWVIEGFPRTKTQALALQKVGIIPDRFILLNVNEDTSIAKIKYNLIQSYTSYHVDEIEGVAHQALEEYKLNIKGVKSSFNNFIYEYDEVGKSQSEVANDLARVLRIRFKSNAPRRPPRVILLGPPGSGRSTQAKKLSQRFGLVYVCTRSLLKYEISKNTPAGKAI